MQSSKDSCVYFIGSLEHGVVKIGVSNNPAQRLQSIQTGCPIDLNLIKTIPSSDAYTLEAELHRRFLKHRKRGEWFDACVLGLIPETEEKSVQIEDLLRIYLDEERIYCYFSAIDDASYILYRKEFYGCTIGSNNWWQNVILNLIRDEHDHFWQFGSYRTLLTLAFKEIPWHAKKFLPVAEKKVLEDYRQEYGQDYQKPKCPKLDRYIHDPIRKDYCWGEWIAEHRLDLLSPSQREFVANMYL